MLFMLKLALTHVATGDVKSGRSYPQVSGGDFEEATPDPFPNSEVKLLGADGTAREAVWESRTLPGFFMDGARDLRALSFCPPDGRGAATGGRWRGNDGGEDRATARSCASRAKRAFARGMHPGLSSR
jgi:hypothetical protein